LTEWVAYERVHGPFDYQWRDELLASIHEQFQRLNRMTGAAHFTSKKHRKNPVPKEKRYPRPFEIVPYEETPDEEEEECFCAQCQDEKQEKKRDSPPQPVEEAVDDSEE
jgi:hypothetical protein